MTASFDIRSEKLNGYPLALKELWIKRVDRYGARRDERPRRLACILSSGL